MEPMNESTSINKTGHISANNGPILKIQNLSYSAERYRPDIRGRRATSCTRGRHACMHA